MAKIRQGDEVIVISGKDKGRRGRVVRLFGDRRVVVENINIARKHQKPNPNAGAPAGRQAKRRPRPRSLSRNSTRSLTTRTWWPGRRS